jgi:Lon protease-like protein
MQDQHDDASAEAHEAHIEGSIVDETAEDQQTPAVADDVLPETLYLIPIPQRPFFPGQVQPVAMNPDEWGGTLKAVAETGTAVVGLTYVDPRSFDGDAPETRHFPEMGCVVRLHRPPMMAENPGQFLAQGLRRFRILRWLSDQPPYRVQVEYPRSQGDRDSDGVKAYAMAVLQAVKELLPLNPLYSEELKQYIANFNPNQPSQLADFSAALTTASGEKLQEILDTLPLQSRMQKVLELLRKEREVAELRGKISDQVNEKVSTQQREFFLREQLKVIEKELGISKDDRTSDAERFRARLEKLTLPEAAQRRIDDELRQAVRARARLARVRRDAQLSRLGDAGALGRDLRGQSRSQARRGGPRSGPRWSRGREGAHSRVPRRRRLQGGDRRFDPAAGRPSGCRQDQYRALRGRRPGPQVLSASALAACATRRRSRGTGAPTSAPCPASSCRRSRKSRCQPGDHARRDRQDRRLLPG